MKRTICTFLILTALVHQNCGSIPAPYVKLQTSLPDAGKLHCADLEKAARKRSIGHQFGGWSLAFLSLASVAATIALTVNLPDGSQSSGMAADMMGSNDSEIKTQKALLGTMPLITAALGAGAFALFNRSQAAGKLASIAATSASNTSDDAAGSECNAAISDWNKSRGDANAELITLLRTKLAEQSKSPSAGTPGAAGTPSAAGVPGAAGVPASPGVPGATVGPAAPGSSPQ